MLAGGRLTVTDAYAYAKFARLALRTNDIDFRARAHSAEEAQFLAARVAGTAPDRGGVTFAALERAPVVLLVALEPEEESASLFLRLRKAARQGSLPVFAVAPLASQGLQKMSGTLIAAGPGDEAAVLTAGAGRGDTRRPTRRCADAAAERNRLGALLRTPGAVVLVGERAAQTPGLLTAVAGLVDATGARLAWVPRRAGERGALDAGALGNAAARRAPAGRPGRPGRGRDGLGRIRPDRRPAGTPPGSWPPSRCPSPRIPMTRPRLPRARSRAAWPAC